MMKKTFRAIAIMLVCLLIMPICVSANSGITLDRAIAISETQIVLEFSEPVAFNYTYQNAGPYTAIRLVNGSDALIWNESIPMQATGSMSYLDSKHDRVLWTISEKMGGTSDITEIVNFGAELGAYYDGYNAIKFCIEEMPYYDGECWNDSLICNVSSADGNRYLEASLPNSYDGVYVPIEVDFEYIDSLSTVEDLSKGLNTVDNFLISVLSKEDAKTDIKTQTVHEDPNMFIIIGVLGGCALLAAVAIVAATAKRRVK